MSRAVLDELDAYYDAVPRPGSHVEYRGPFTLFVASAGWPYYARPRRGYGGPAVTIEDVDAVRERQRALKVPETFEWVDELSPDLADLLSYSGLTVHRHPLQVLEAPLDVARLDGVRTWILAADSIDTVDPTVLACVNAVVALGFAAEGTAVGPAGATERDAMAEAGTDDYRAHQASRIRAGLTAMAVAEDRTGPVAAGSHTPVGAVTEITGVATLPSARRRGLGAAVTSALVGDARRRGVDTVFLSASSDDVARVYAKVGFRRVGTACTADEGD